MDNTNRPQEAVQISVCICVCLCMYTIIIEGFLSLRRNFAGDNGGVEGSEEGLKIMYM